MSPTPRWSQSAFAASRACANDAVTTVTGKEGTRDAAASCLVTSPCIIEAEGVDGSTKGAKERSVASLQVCCIKLGRALLINRNMIGSNGVLWGV